MSSQKNCLLLKVAFLLFTCVFLWKLFLWKTLDGVPSTRPSSIAAMEANRITNEWFEVPKDNNTTGESFRVYHAYYHYQISDIIVVVYSRANELKHPGPHFCAIYDFQKKLVTITQGKFHTAYLFYCGLDNATSPINLSYIHLVGRQLQNVVNPPWIIPITNLERKKGAIFSGEKELKKFAVHCTVYDNPNQLMLIQFFEWYKMQGASKFIISNPYDDKKLPDDVMKILDHYHDQNLLEYWDTYPPCHIINSFLTCHLMMVNNLVLQLAHEYKYVLMVDFDELLQPADKYINLLQLVESMDKPEYSSFTFAAVYHNTRTVVTNPSMHLSELNQLDIPSLVRERLPFMNYNTSAMGCVSHGYCSKTIVKPEFIQKMWVHFVRESFDGKRTFDVPCYSSTNKKEELGYFHHFKNATRWHTVNESLTMTTYESRPPFISAEGKTLNIYQTLLNNVIQSVLEIRTIL